MLACPSKANQATTLQLRTYFRNGGAAGRPPDANYLIVQDRKKTKKRKDVTAEGRSVVCFYYIWTVI